METPTMTLEDFNDHLERKVDWTFMMSDDSSAYRRGAKTVDDAFELAKKLGKEFIDLFKARQKKTFNMIHGG